LDRLSDSAILKKIERQSKSTAGFKQLVRELGLHGAARQELSQRLQRLINSGQLVQIDSDRYAIPKAATSKNVLVGRLSMHRDGYGFVTPDAATLDPHFKALLAGDIFIPPPAVGSAMHGDRVLVEAPTYLGALQAFSVYGAQFLTVPIDDDGLRTDQLESSLRLSPKFMYILPNFQNPAGVTLSEGRRHQLIFLADKYGIPIIEDDPYGQLRYEGEHLAPLVVLDRENLRRDNGFTLGNVIYLSTFSKTLAPGIRLAWIVAPPDVVSKLVMLKQAADLHTATFNQMVAYEVAKDGFLDQHVKRIRQVYRERRDVMLQALQEFFPAEVTWTHPKGGLFLWVTMPEGTDCRLLFRAALAENVAFVPGDCFYGNDLADGCRHMRLNFSHSEPELIREGIRRLSVAVKMHLRTSHAPLEVAGGRR